MIKYFDSHAHYNDEKFNEDRDNIINELYNKGITNIINAGYNLNSTKEAIQISDKYQFIYATAGISPNDLTDYSDEALNEIFKMAKNKKIVAIGEIGLDYYWDKENKSKQQEAFIKQIEIANNINKPIVIHTREAIYDTLEILKNKIECKEKGVFHCCPLNVDLVREALKLGFYISFAGPVTFKSSKNANDVINMVPIEKMLIETDSPYLSPEPVRGTRNNSENLKYIANKIAIVKQKSLEEIASVTYKNTKEIFKI
jgi:TatD DNase family protein